MTNQKYLEELKIKFPLDSIIKVFDEIKNLKVLLIGDTILDEYVFTFTKGRAIKDPILSLDFIKSECYPGGILAIANHVAEFIDNLSLITILGENERKEEFIKDNLNKKIKTKFFTKKNSPTTNKKRYIDSVRHSKLFKVEYLDDNPIDQETEDRIVEHLKEELPKYDIVIVGDFGHGFISQEIIKTLEKHSKFLAANVQTNSSNAGFNYVTKYNRIDYLTSNENEIRLAFADRFGSLLDITDKLKEKSQFKSILLTKGKLGSTYIKNNGVWSGPSLTEEIRDVVGAGDAVFAITSLLNYNDLDGKLFVFLANCIGAMAVKIMGNEKSISKENLIKFIGELK